MAGSESPSFRASESYDPWNLLHLSVPQRQARLQKSASSYESGSTLHWQ